MIHTWFGFKVPAFVNGSSWTVLGSQAMGSEKNNGEAYMSLKSLSLKPCILKGTKERPACPPKA